MKWRTRNRRLEIKRRGNSDILNIYKSSKSNYGPPPQVDFTSVSGTLCREPSHRYYIVKKQYFMFMAALRFASSSNRGFLIGYIRFNKDKVDDDQNGDGSSSKASKTGTYIGGAVGAVALILIITIVISCWCKRSHHCRESIAATNPSQSQATISATYIVANACAEVSVMQKTEKLGSDNNP
eukprot:gene15822-7133_t